MGCSASHLDDANLSGLTRDHGQVSSHPTGSRGSLRHSIRKLCSRYRVDLGQATVRSARPSSETSFGCQQRCTGEPASLRVAFVRLHGEACGEPLQGKPVLLRLTPNQQTVADLAKWVRQELDRQYGTRFELHSLRLHDVTIYQSAAAPSCADTAASDKGAAAAAGDEAAYASRQLRDLLSAASVAATAKLAAPAMAPPAAAAEGLPQADVAVTIATPDAAVIPVLQAVVCEPPHVWVQLLGNAEGPCPLRLRLGVAPLDDPRVTVGDLVDAAIAIWRSKYRQVTANGPVTALLAAGWSRGPDPHQVLRQPTLQQPNEQQQQQQKQQHQHQPPYAPALAPLDQKLQQQQPASLQSSAEEEDEAPVTPAPPPMVLRSGDLLNGMLRSGDLVLLDGVTCSGCKLYLSMAPPFVGCLLDDDSRLELESD